MSRPKLKEKDKKQGISVSMSPDVLRDLKKETLNISQLLEELVVKWLKGKKK